MAPRPDWQDETLLAAWHEAAHAVAGTALGRGANYLAIGLKHWRRSAATYFAGRELRPEEEVMISLAGIAGELLLGNDLPWPNARNDLSDATQRAAAVVGPSRAEAAVGQCWQATVRLFLDQHANALVRMIAWRAIKHRALDANDLRAIFRAFQGPLPSCEAPRWGQQELPLDPPMPPRHSA